MVLQEGSSEKVRELVIRDDAENGQWITTDIDSNSNILEQKYYDSTTTEITKTLYYASFKLLDDFDATGNWSASNDASGIAVNSGGWMDGSTDVTRVTYTYSAGTATITDNTTTHGDLSNYIGSNCDQGQVMVLMKYSDFSNVTSLELRIGSASGDYRSVSLTGSVTQNSWTDNDEWFGLVFDLSDGSSTGSPDGTTVDYIQFNWTVASGSSQTIDLKDLYIAYETESEITGNDFYFVRRQRLDYNSEGKIIDYEYIYESENEGIIDTNISGGY